MLISLIDFIVANPFIILGIIIILFAIAELGSIFQTPKYHAKSSYKIVKYG